MPPELILLDVAHGNCALVIGEDTVAVIDAPHGGLHIDALKERSARDVHTVVISHADADHMGGVAHLLYDEEVRIHTVYVNTDASKTAGGGGLVWQNFVIALTDAERRGEVVVVPIKRGDNVDLSDDRIRLEILAPSTELTLLGVGGRFEGQALTSNSLSVVVRVWFEDQPIALLTGDLDWLGLQKLLQEGDDLHTQVLVFPHHGGSSGGDDGAFANAISNAVNPETIVFSFGREQYHNPQPEIINGIRSTKPRAKIMCTQLSKACSQSTFDPVHIGPLPAKGRDQGRCCAGSLRFTQEGLREPLGAEHRDFVAGLVPTPMCLRSPEQT